MPYGKNLNGHCRMGVAAPANSSFAVQENGYCRAEGIIFLCSGSLNFHGRQVGSLQCVAIPGINISKSETDLDTVCYSSVKTEKDF